METKLLFFIGLAHYQNYTGLIIKVKEELSNNEIC
jgi:hypothetical protein